MGVLARFWCVVIGGLGCGLLAAIVTGTWAILPITLWIAIAVFCVALPLPEDTYDARHDEPEYDG